MNRIAIFLLSIAAGGALAWVVATKSQQTKYNALLASHQTAWEKEKAALEEALRNRPKEIVTLTPAIKPAEPAVKPPTPREIIEILKDPKFAGSPRGIRLAIHHLELLIASGTNALPAIREFLAENQDIAYDALGGNRRGRSSMSTDFIIPPSLRFGLFDAAKQIGGPDAEKLLADTLQTAGRATEVSWLARTLQEMSPDKYRDIALAAAHDLLMHPPEGSINDRSERDLLYGVLSMYNDTSLVNQSQAQLIQPDGQIDRSALKYLHKSLGEQSLPIAMQAYNDPNVDPSKKEPLARVGLYYAGENAQANQLFDVAIHDEHLSVDARRNYIEDLNQDGIMNEKSPTPEDLKTINARLKLIDAYNASGNITDPKLRAAFAEAQKDLFNMAKAAGSSTR